MATTGDLEPDDGLLDLLVAAIQPQNRWIPGVFDATTSQETADDGGNGSGNGCGGYDGKDGGEWVEIGGKQG